LRNREIVNQENLDWLILFMRFFLYPLLVSGIFFFISHSTCVAAEFVWWEAETPTKSNFPPESESPFQKSTLDANQLSGGDWLSAARGNTGEPYTATYEIEVPVAGDYHFWIRKCWHHALFTWAFDNGKGPTGAVTRQAALLDSVSLRDKVPANWIDAGPVTLSEGTHTFTIVQTGSGAFAVDCFALIPFDWSPRGKLKPGERSGLEQKGFAAFEPEVDPFTDKALLDLRGLNQEFSGAAGRVMMKEGDFYFEEAPEQPVRFWGEVTGPSAILASDAMQERYLRRMAKLGVNMIRLHGNFHGGVNGEPLAISDDYLDRFDHFIATCRENGIYFMLNTYYDKWLKGSDVGAGYGDNKAVNCWQFIDPDGQALWKEWTTRLLDRVNPYTGLRNADDPTIAIIQLSNENNYFFYTFQPYQSIPTEVMVHMEAQYAEWLTERYENLSAAVAAWGDEAHPRDDPEASRLGLLSAQALKGAGQRGRDQAAFLVNDYLQVTDGFIAHLRSMGYQGLINNGNWLSADPLILEPLDKLANMNGEVMSRHGVLWGADEDLEVFFAVKAGDKFRSRSALFEPWKLPLSELQYNDKAHMICEPKTTTPNRFRAEWLPLAACWGAMQGMDAQVHFAASLDWQGVHQRWGIDEPVVMGQSSALSLIFRKGYIQEAPVVVEEVLDRQALLDLQGAAFHPVSSISGGEILPSDLGQIRLDTDAENGINPLALMTGSLRRTIADNPENTGLRVDDRVAELIDVEKGELTTVTGELVLNWKQGLLTLRAPKAQGAVGFVGNMGAIDLPDVEVDCENEYASLLFVPLDDRPLADSTKILVSVVTETENYGFETKPATFQPRRGDPVEGREIVNAGRFPIQHLEPKGVVRLKREDAGSLTVTALDWNGYPIDSFPYNDGIQLRGDAITYLVTK